MQKRRMKTEMVMVAVPAEMMLEAGIFEGNPMQMYVEGRRLVIENLDDIDDFVCGGDCSDCPISEIDCNGDCESCPCWDECDDAEVDEYE